MDTTFIAYKAEDLIAHKLEHEGILVAKPKFDRDGCDLLALLSVKEGASFCRIQCKGRSFFNSNTTHIDIPSRYVTDSLIVFLYLEETKEKDSLYCFFPEDIRVWNKNDKDEYILSIRKTTYEEKLRLHHFDPSMISRIKYLISCANAKRELSMIIGTANIDMPALSVSGEATVSN